MKTSKDLSNKKQVRIAYKSQISGLSENDRKRFDDTFFKVNQLYNFAIELLSKKEIQEELVSLEFAKFITQTYIPKNSDKPKEIEKIVLLKLGKIRDYISKKFIKYMDDRKLSIKGLSKPLQLKLEDFISRYNKINLSAKKSHNYKITSPNKYASFETDSSIELKKVKVKMNKKQKKSGKIKSKTQYYVKIGKYWFKFKNNKLNIKHFELKKITLSRDNLGKYSISLSGINSIESNKPPLNLKQLMQLNSIGIDVNFESIVLSNGIKYETYNMQNKLNLFTKELDLLQKEKSKREILNKDIWKSLCKTDEIVKYKPNSKKMTSEAKELYRTILSGDKIYVKIVKKINKLFEKRTNIQNEKYKDIIKTIVNDYDLFFIEDLNVENMVNKEVNNQNLYNASLQKFLTLLKNKIRTKGKIYHEVESYNTSRKCSTINCNYSNFELKKEEREWICPKCRVKHDRDINAAINIKERGIKYFKTQGAEYKFNL